MKKIVHIIKLSYRMCCTARLAASYTNLGQINKAKALYGK